MYCLLSFLQSPASRAHQPCTYEAELYSTAHSLVSIVFVLMSYLKIVNEKEDDHIDTYLDTVKGNNDCRSPENPQYAEYVQQNEILYGLIELSPIFQN